jgi:hypothetical protein
VSLYCSIHSLAISQFSSLLFCLPIRQSPPLKAISTRDGIFSSLDSTAVQLRYYNFWKPAVRLQNNTCGPRDYLHGCDSNTNINKAP